MEMKIVRTISVWCRSFLQDRHHVEYEEVQYAWSVLRLYETLGDCPQQPSVCVQFTTNPRRNLPLCRSKSLSN